MSYASDEPRVPRRPRAPRAHALSEAELAERQRIQIRDGGLWRIGAATRWLLAGAVSAAGALALLAASTFHGHTLPPPTAQAASANSASQTAGSAGPIAAPAQSPTTSTAPAVVVSGGS